MKYSSDIPLGGANENDINESGDKIPTAKIGT